MNYFRQHIIVCEMYVNLGLLGRTELAAVIKGGDLRDVHSTVLNNILLFLENVALLMCRDVGDVSEPAQLIIKINNFNKRHYLP